MGFLVADVDSDSLDELNEEINRLNRITSRLPVRNIQPVGGTLGFKWLDEPSDSKVNPWLEISFSKATLLDSVVVVPLATFSKSKVRAYCMPKEIKVTLMGVNQVIFEGPVSDLHMSTAIPIYLGELNLRRLATGIRIEVLNTKTSDPYLGLSEVFAFRRGLNVALGAEIAGSNHVREENNLFGPQYLVDGQSSLGMPVYANYSSSFRRKSRSWFKRSPNENAESHEINIFFRNISKVHEIRFFPDYASNDIWPNLFGQGFPKSFKLELLDINGKSVSIIFDGPFNTPGRNLVSFNGRSVEAAALRMTIQDFYEDIEWGRKYVSLSEIQILDTENNNLSENAEFELSGLVRFDPPKTSKKSIDTLNDGLTRRGKILELESWLKGVADEVILTKEMKVLRSKKSRQQAKHNQLIWISFLGIILLLIGAVVMTIYKSRMREKKVLAKMRKELANDLHDEIGSNLSSIGLITYDLEKSKASETIIDIVEDSKDSLRTMVWALSAQPISLMSKIRESATRLLVDVEYDLKIRSPEPWDQLSIKQRQDILFWIKEALNNVYKHSEATFVNIVLKGNYKSSPLTVSIKDNGKGMDLEEYRDDLEHLARLQARALKLNAQFKIKSTPGNGCEVYLILDPKP